MKHALLNSRQFGVTDEGINVNWGAWTHSRISGEYDDDRLERAYFGDNLRKLGIMGRYTQDGPKLASIGACADILLRFSALPRTSFYFSGGCHAGRQYHERVYRGEATQEFIEYHHEVLAALGTLVYHPNFAYAPDLESFGAYDIEAKKAVQAEFVASIREVYPGLPIILTAGGYGNPKDVLEYGGMPADGCLLRMCFYEPFPATHAMDRGLDAPLSYPATAGDVAKAIKPDMTTWVRAELAEAIGYGRTQMRELLLKVKATGLPVLCQEAGFGRMNASAVPAAARWHSDVRAVFWALGLPVMEFAAGLNGGSGKYFHLGVGLDPDDSRNADGRLVAGLG